MGREMFLVTTRNIRKGEKQHKENNFLFFNFSSTSCQVRRWRTIIVPSSVSLVYWLESSSSGWGTDLSFLRWNFSFIGELPFLLWVRSLRGGVANVQPAAVQLALSEGEDNRERQRDWLRESQGKYREDGMTETQTLWNVKVADKLCEYEMDNMTAMERGEIDKALSFHCKEITLIQNNMSEPHQLLVNVKRSYELVWQICLFGVSCFSTFKTITCVFFFYLWKS